jgi:hypothetical protein
MLIWNIRFYMKLHISSQRLSIGAMVVWTINSNSNNDIAGCINIAVCMHLQQQ